MGNGHAQTFVCLLHICACPKLPSDLWAVCADNIFAVAALVAVLLTVGLIAVMLSAWLLIDLRGIYLFGLCLCSLPYCSLLHPSLARAPANCPTVLLQMRRSSPPAGGRCSRSCSSTSSPRPTPPRQTRQTLWTQYVAQWLSRRGWQGARLLDSALEARSAHAVRSPLPRAVVVALPLARSMPVRTSTSTGLQVGRLQQPQHGTARWMR